MPLLVASIAALPALLAFAIFGVIETPDSGGYIAYATQILHRAIPSGTALLRESPSPITLFRMGGFPALLAALQTLFPQCWKAALVLLQIAAQSAVASLAYVTARRLGVRPWLAAAAALLPATGFAVVVELCILTDAIYAALASAAALLLAARADLRAALYAGVMLGLATSFREATPFVACSYLPLAFAAPHGRGRRAALVLLPAVIVAGAQIGWNAARGAGPVLTTTRQTVMVQALLPLLRHHYPVYDGDDPFDRAARATLGPGRYEAIPALHARLFGAGMTAPQMATLAGARYARAWRRFPAAMLRATAQNFRLEFLAMPFQPADTLSALLVYAGWRPPGFDRFGALWARLWRVRHEPARPPGSGAASRAAYPAAGNTPPPGSPEAATAWIALDLVTRPLGFLIGVAAVFAPWLAGRSTPDAVSPASNSAREAPQLETSRSGIVQASGDRPAAARRWQELWRWWAAADEPRMRRWRLCGLWCVSAGFLLIYLPVHVEPRYLVPVIPLACVLAAATLDNAATLLGKIRLERVQSGPCARPFSRISPRSASALPSLRPR